MLGCFRRTYQNCLLLVKNFFYLSFPIENPETKLNFSSLPEQKKFLTMLKQKPLIIIETRKMNRRKKEKHIYLFEKRKFLLPLSRSSFFFFIFLATGQQPASSGDVKDKPSLLLLFLLEFAPFSLIVRIFPVL